MISRRIVSHRWMAGVVVMTIAACTDPPEPAWRVLRPRVLGAEVSVTSDIDRSSPLPGERVRVDLVTASREAARGAFATHALRICPADPNTSIFACAGADVAFQESGGIEPTITFDAPRSLAPVMVFGIFCTGGTARIASAASLAGECGGATGQELAVRIDVGGPTNRRPLLAPESARIDAAELSPGDDCVGPGLLADGTKRALSVALAPGSIEPGDDLVLSHLATHGELDCLYSTPGEDGSFRVEWGAPSALGEPREVARFYFVLRDGRGGASVLVRTICLSKGS